jgi:hypothetical protein
MYYWDNSGSASYVSEVAIAANDTGRIAFGSIQDYDGSSGYYIDTLLVRWDANNIDDLSTDGGVYWRNTDSNENPIPYSNLCAAAGEKIFFVFQRDPLNGNSEISTTYSKVDETTLYSDWTQKTVARSNNCNYTFPDISVTGNKAFVTYMGDENGNQDIYVATSTTGSFWRKYQVTDSADDELYPVISANGDEAIILFMKNNNLYVTNSDDGGETWSAPVQVNDVSDTVVEEYRNVDVKSNFGIWTDNRNGNNDLFFDTVGSSAILNIESVSGGFGLSATVSNVGNAPAEAVEWSIDIDGLVIIGSHKEGTIDLLDPDDSVTINTGFILGLGKATITVAAGEVSTEVSATILGPFVLGVS